MDVLAFPDVEFPDLLPLNPSLSEVPEPIREQVSREALYANYIDRQQRDIEKMRRDEALIIPAQFDYTAIQGLSAELGQKLTTARPANLGQAAKIEGMTPAALALLLSHLRKSETVAKSA